MPVPVTAWTDLTPITAKSLNLALATSDGTADNPSGTAFHAYRPVLFEAYTRATAFHGSSGGSTSTMSTSGTVTTCQVVYDTPGYSGQSADLPGAGYYQFTSAVLGSAGDGVTPGGWSVLSHFAPLKPAGTQTSVSADLLPTGGTAVAGSRQAPNTVNDSTPFFCDLQNVGTTAWQPAVTIRDSAGSAATLAVNTTDSSGETPRFYSLWAAVSATSSGSASFILDGSYSWTAPAGVTQVTVAAAGAGGGGGGGNVSPGGVQYGGGGGGGGEYSLGTVAVTPGNIYPVTVGAAGVAGTQPGGNGGNGGNSAVTGDAATITGHGGSAGAGATTSANGAGGAGGTGSGATTHFNGGAGNAGTTASSGGGGGSSAGTGTAGNAATDGTGAPAPDGGGPGGNGGSAAVRVVQTATGHAHGKASLAVSFGAAIQAGSTVVVSVLGQKTDALAAVALSDGTELSSVVTADYSGIIYPFTTDIWAVYNVTGGQAGIVVTIPSSSVEVILVQMLEVAGLGSAPNVDTSASATANSSSYSVTASPGAAPDLWVGACGASYPSTPSINSPGGSWTMFSTTSDQAASGYHMSLRSGYQVASAPGTLKFSGKLGNVYYHGVSGAAFTAGGSTTGAAPVTGPGGGGGAGLGASNGGAGYDGAVTLTWTAASGSGYGTPPLPVPYSSWSAATTAGAPGAGVDVDINGPAGITDVLNFLSSPPVARVAALTAQSIPSATLTPVTFSGTSASVDSYGGYSAGTYTIARDGLYLFHGLVCFAQAASGTRQAGATVSGVTYWGPGYTPASSGGTHATKTQVFSLRAGDTVQLACRQDSGGAVALSTTSATRFFLVWLCAPGLPQQTWSPPDTTFRWSSGTSGDAMPGLLQAHLANDLGFLVNRPYLLAYQGTAQSGLAVGSFSTVTLDTVGGIVHSDTGDNYAGWTQGPSNLYTAPCAGWWLMTGEYFAASSAASGATVAAGIKPSTSGGYAPSQPADVYQQLTATSTASVGAGATVLGLQYCSAGETIQPQIKALSYAAPYGTLTGASNGGQVNSHLEIIWLAE